MISTKIESFVTKFLTGVPEKYTITTKLSQHIKNEMSQKILNNTIFCCGPIYNKNNPLFQQ
jgi:hypothetical protein